MTSTLDTPIAPPVTTAWMSMKSPFVAVKLCVRSWQLVAVAPDIVQVSDWETVASLHVNAIEIPVPSATEIFAPKLLTVAVAGANAPIMGSFEFGLPPPPIGKYVVAPDDITPVLPA